MRNRLIRLSAVGLLVLAARLEIQHAIETLFRRLPGLRLGDGEVVYKPQLHLHGLAQLPVAW